VIEQIIFHHSNGKVGYEACFENGNLHGHRRLYFTNGNYDIDRWKVKLENAIDTIKQGEVIYIGEDYEEHKKFMKTNIDMYV
jgi:antitoxin component YwqK of YwqJK toxin-antitoxin module